MATALLKLKQTKSLSATYGISLHLMAREGFTTERGVKFVLAETGTTYDFSVCNDPELAVLETKLKDCRQGKKQKKSF